MLIPHQCGAQIGGIGLFPPGMWLMTERLRLAAGAALREVLTRSTRARWRALGSGIILAAVVQSSSAATVAAIGFVHAGLLTLGQVLWVLFGSNVGTTMTGWLVALLGLQIKIGLIALPLIGAGMLPRLTGGGSRRGSFGLALAGFGVLFLGIDTRAAAWDLRYRQLMADLLEAGALGTPTPGDMALLLRSNSALRRTVRQALKTAQAWHAVNPARVA